jgi:rhamnosyltransferase
VVVVDNASPAVSQGWLSAWAQAGEGRHFLPQSDNLGIGAAQNLGVAQVRALGLSHVLLSDQDSLPAPDMVEKLLAATTASGQPLALAAPVFVPMEQLSGAGNGAASAADGHFLAQVDGAFRRVSCPAGGVREVDVAIASGSLIPLAVFEAVGAFDESLFIDAVDTEWCLRARALGYAILAVGSARLGHRLGDECRRIWLPGGWRRVPIHAPQRTYTIARNNLRICRYPHVSAAWRRYVRAMLWRRLGFFLLLGPQRLAHLAALWRGCRDA